MIVRTPPALPPGRTLLLGLSGSHLYGLAGPKSDEDWRGVYQLPTSEMVGLEAKGLTAWERKPDVTCWELGHFCRLLLKGNPNIVEMLWMPPDVVSVPPSGMLDVLVQNRDRFLTRAMGRAYLGWVMGELKAAERNPAFPGKRAHHIPRLLSELESAIEGRMTVRPAGDDRDLMLSVKRSGLGEPEWFQRLMRDRVERLKNRLYALLPEPPTEWVQDLLVEQRRILWGRP